MGLGPRGGGMSRGRPPDHRLDDAGLDLRGDPGRDVPAKDDRGGPADQFRLGGLRLPPPPMPTRGPDWAPGAPEFALPRGPGRRSTYAPGPPAGGGGGLCGGESGLPGRADGRGPGARRKGGGKPPGPKPRGPGPDVMRGGRGGRKPEKLLRRRRRRRDPDRGGRRAPEECGGRRGDLDDLRFGFVLSTRTGPLALWPVWIRRCRSGCRS